MKNIRTDSNPGSDSTLGDPKIRHLFKFYENQTHGACGGSVVDRALGYSMGVVISS